jgi:CubicO group peptidase (beta-lactamase class C family)
MTSLEASLDEAVPELLRMTGTPGLSIAVALDGEPAIVRAWGAHDLAGGRPLTPASIFPAGSMTKLYTAVAVLQLVEAGAIGLHDPVSAHLDGIRCANPLGAREITVYDLLTFRSGLATDTTACSLEPPPPLAEHVARSLAAGHGPEYAGGVPRWGAPVGTRYHYANLGVSLLGLLVERRNPDGLALPEYVRARVLEPLGMESSWLSAWDEPPHPDRASGYACFGPELTVPTPELRSADWPANGLHTTPADHLRLLLALADGGGPLLERGTVRLMLTPQVSMAGGDGVFPDSGWWTGLVAIMSGLGTRLAHFGHPGSHMWGWWCISRAYPRLGCAVVACVNGWDMLRWHNPSNRDAAVMAVELVAEHAAAARGDEPPARSWRWKRSYVAGALMAERTAGGLGVDGEPELHLDGARGVDPDGFRAGLAAATAPLDGERAAHVLRDGADAPPPEQLEALLHDLGMAYGCPLPLWFWPDAPPQAPLPASTARAMTT